MGSRGPAAKPANVHYLRGNPSKKSQGELSAEFNPAVEIPDTPSWIWPEAKKEWRRISEELVRYGLISRLDRAALVLYCQSWAKMVWAEKMLSRAMKIAEEKRQAAEAAGLEWSGEDGIMVRTPNGNLTYSHYWVVGRRSSEDVNRYLALFGLSPSSRTRVTPSNNLQPDLFADGATGTDPWSGL